MKLTRRLILTSCLVLTSTAGAHPTGHHGGLSETIAHLVGSPYHVVVMLSGLAVGAFCLWKVLRPAGK